MIDVLHVFYQFFLKTKLIKWKLFSLRFSHSYYLNTSLGRRLRVYNKPENSAVAVFDDIFSEKKWQLFVLQNVLPCCMTGQDEEAKIYRVLPRGRTKKDVLRSSLVNTPKTSSWDLPLSFQNDFSKSCDIK